MPSLVPRPAELHWRSENKCRWRNFDCRSSRRAAPEASRERKQRETHKLGAYVKALSALSPKGAALVRHRPGDGGSNASPTLPSPSEPFFPNATKFIPLFLTLWFPQSLIT